MNKFNFHTHTTFCDGKYSVDQMCEAAIKKNMQILGFSSHAPVPFKNNWSMAFSDIHDYIGQLKSAQERFGSMIQIFKGLEADFIPERTIPFADWYKLLGLDYIIGGIHFVAKEGIDRLWNIDSGEEQYAEGIKEIFGGDAKAAVSAYFSQIRTMVEQEKPDIVAHMDKVVMYNRGRFFDPTEQWYLDEVEKTLDVIERTGTIVEINTRGLYKKRHDDFFPSKAIIRQCITKGIPLTISADAHDTEEVDQLFSEASSTITSNGGRHVMYLNHGRWNQVAIPDIN
jgi:histidinol-phosphatase (PHP family)